MLRHRISNFSSWFVKQETQMASFYLDNCDSMSNFRRLKLEKEYSLYDYAIRLSRHRILYCKPHSIVNAFSLIRSILTINADIVQVVLTNILRKMFCNNWHSNLRLWVPWRQSTLRSSSLLFTLVATDQDPILKKLE